MFYTRASSSARYHNIPKFTDAAWLIGVLAGFAGGIAIYELGLIGIPIGLFGLLILMYLGPTGFIGRAIQKIFSFLGFILGATITLGVTLLVGPLQTIVVGGSLLIFVIGWTLHNTQYQ